MRGRRPRPRRARLRVRDLLPAHDLRAAVLAERRGEHARLGRSGSAAPRYGIGSGQATRAALDVRSPPRQSAWAIRRRPRRRRRPARPAASRAGRRPPCRRRRARAPRRRAPRPRPGGHERPRSCREARALRRDRDLQRQHADAAARDAPTLQAVLELGDAAPQRRDHGEALRHRHRDGRPPRGCRRPAPRRARARRRAPGSPKQAMT